MATDDSIVPVISSGDGDDDGTKYTFLEIFDSMWCFEYCYLFPQNYEFQKDDIMQLWMAERFIPDPPPGFVLPPPYQDVTEWEDVASIVFSLFERLDIFQLSGLDSSTGRPRYQLNSFIANFLQAQHLDTYFRPNDVGSYSYISSNTVYCSFPDSVDPSTLKDLWVAQSLRTLLILHEPGACFDQVPRDLFLKLPMLRVLDFSNTNIMELPSSVGNLKSLAYINLSGTPLTTLPESLCSLNQMQTLKLRGCSKLLGLPKGIRKLRNLRHLDVDAACLLVSMPAGLGDLTSLRILPAFVVSKQNGCHITELKHMEKLRGTLAIFGLENIYCTKDATEAALGQKEYLHMLEFHWAELQDSLEIFESLRPHENLKGLQIVGYGDVKFPSWIEDPSFSFITSISIHNCMKCKVLPSLGNLPALKSLSLSDIHAVRTIGGQFYGRDTVMGLIERLTTKEITRRSGKRNMERAFPSLESLTLNAIPKLEKWSGMEEGDFPCLRELNISCCSKLSVLPELSLLESLQQLEITMCPLLKSLPSKGLPTSLQCLVLVDCPMLKRQAQKEGRDWRKIAHIRHLWIDHKQQIPSLTWVDYQQQMPSLRSSRKQASPPSTSRNSPLPSQNFETNVQKQSDTDVEKGNRVGVDSLGLIKPHGSPEKEEASLPSTAGSSPLPFQNFETNVQEESDIDVKKGNRAGVDSLVLIKPQWSSEKEQASPPSTAGKSPLPSQNFETNVQKQSDTEVEKGNRAGVDSLKPQGSSEKEQASPPSTAGNSPLPPQNFETNVQKQLDTDVEKGNRAGVDSLKPQGSSEKEQNKVVLKLMTMTNEKTKRKAMGAVIDIPGVDSVAADMREQKLTVIGDMDATKIEEKLKKIGKVEIISGGPAK